MAWKRLTSTSQEEIGRRLKPVARETIVAIQGYCPPGEWDRFEPLLRAIVESLTVS